MDVKNLWKSKKGPGPFQCLERKFGIFNNVSPKTSNRALVEEKQKKQGEPQHKDEQYEQNNEQGEEHQDEEEEKEEEEDEQAEGTEGATRLGG